MSRVFMLIGVFFLLNTLVLGEDAGRQIDRMLEKYDKRIRPDYGGDRVIVGITMYILGITHISEKDMEWGLDCYFRQTWKDSRLRFSGTETFLQGNSELADKLWTPDTFMVNVKDSKKGAMDNEFIKISKDGDVLRSNRMSLTASCPMDLRYFPMDNQLCTLEIESYGFTMTDISFIWAKGSDSVGISADVSLPEYRVVGHRQQQLEILLLAGNYSRLALEVQLTRSVGNYVMNIYLPAGFLVVLSWISFWIRRTATTARVFIGTTTILSLLVIFIMTANSLPKISYMNILSFYLLVCIIMALLALLETSTVGYTSKQIKMRESAEGLTNGKGTYMGMNDSQMDKWSRIIFPACFAIFNILYWIICPIISDVVEDDLIPVARF